MVKLFDFEYHVKIWFEYDRFGFNLSRPSLGSPLMVWCTKSIPVIHFGHFRIAPKWPISPKVTIFKHFGNGQNVSLELISVYQTIKGNPNGGQDELEPEGDEMPFLTFETRSRFCFLPSRASIQDQDFFTKFQGSRWDRDFCSLNLRLRDEIEIFFLSVSGFETRSRISFS